MSLEFFVRQSLRQLKASFRASRPRRRRGIILIFVVAVLVLMSLIGAAYLTTVRTDRYASRQNAVNTQVDLLLEGLVNITTSAVTKDVFDTSGVYRPPVGGTFDDTDSAVGDLHLADRVPFGAVYWQNVGWPLTQPAGSNLGFHTPTSGTTLSLAKPWTTGTWPRGSVVTYSVSGKINYYVCKADPSAASAPTVVADWDLIPAKANYYFLPTSLPSADGLTIYPAFQLFNSLASTSAYPAVSATAMSAPFLAGDADGDGIADSGLWKLPVAPIEGVTYYAAVRIVDQNSAINANTAWSSTSDFNASGAACDTLGTALPASKTNLGVFPSHVGLLELLDPAAGPAEMVSLNTYRFGGVTTPAGVNGMASPNQDPVSDVNAARTDFKFNTQGEALWTQLGRRIDNPGRSRANINCQGFGASEALSLAQRFIVKGTSANALEGKLPTSLYTTARANAYAPGDAATWFTKNFIYDVTLTPPVSYRPLVTTFNPTSNALRVNNLSTAAAFAGNELLGTVVKYNNNYYISSGCNEEYENERVPDATWPVKDNTSPWWIPVSSAQPARIAINTASFDELVTGFVLMMTKQGTTGKFDTTPFNRTLKYISNVDGTGPLTVDPYLDPYLAAKAPFTHPDRMFRSPVRSLGNNDAMPPTPERTNPAFHWKWYDSTKPVVIDPNQMVYLRAMMAAVNVLDMRDPDDDVTSIRVPIRLRNYKPQHDKKGFCFIINGIEKQPYITEIYGNGDTSVNAAGYLAIELHNPYNTPISLKNYRIYARNADLTSGNGLTIVKNFTDATPPVVPANGYLVIDNYPNAATPRPANAVAQSDTLVPDTCNYYSLPTLRSLVAGKEIILMRPHRADGTLTNAGPIDETDGSNEACGFVPIDQFDFFGYPASDGATKTQLHYVRANGPGGEWKFIYPGKYNGDLTRERFIGTKQVSYTAPEPAMAVAAKIGGGDPIACYSPTFTIQLANLAGGAPAPIVAGTGNRFPYGGFARQGDLAQIPFLGSYYIALYKNNGNGNDKVKGMVECNSFTMDASFADDADGGADDAFEPLGRFSPMRHNPLFPATLPDHYSWANIGDYFTTLANPNDDALPNVGFSDWEKNKPYLKGELVTNATNAYTCATPWSGGTSFAAGNFTLLFTKPTDVSNSIGTTANTGNEDDAPVQGLININTAPWRVLAAVPWTRDVEWNRDVAMSIVRARGTGVFTSLFDLKKVPVYDYDHSSTPTPGASPVCTLADVWWKAQGATQSLATSADGDFSPNTLGTVALADLEQQNIGITRVSNLLTTRSDAFTCYVLLQGWTGAGTPSAKLAVQRRAYFVVDRSSLSQTQKQPVVYRMGSVPE